MGIACDHVTFMHFLKQLLYGGHVDNEMRMGAKEGIMGDEISHGHLTEGLVDEGEGATLGGHDDKGVHIGEGGETETEGVGGSLIGGMLVTGKRGG